MLIACWSAKGGAGTTVVAATLGLVLAKASPGGVLLADLAGDLPAVLGVPDGGQQPPAEVRDRGDDAGLADWLRAGADVPADGLQRLERPVTTALSLLARGEGLLADERALALAQLLDADDRPAVVDCGTGPTGAARVVAEAAERSLLVTRPCFVALRRAMAAPLRPEAVVLVSEPGRSLGARDVEACLGCPVVAEGDVDPAVARAVDAGLLATRLPRGLARELRRAC